MILFFTLNRLVSLIEFNSKQNQTKKRKKKKKRRIFTASEIGTVYSFHLLWIHELNSPAVEIGVGNFFFLSKSIEPLRGIQWEEKLALGFRTENRNEGSGLVEGGIFVPPTTDGVDAAVGSTAFTVTNLASLNHASFSILPVFYHDFLFYFVVGFFFEYWKRVCVKHGCCINMHYWIKEQMNRSAKRHTHPLYFLMFQARCSTSNENDAKVLVYLRLRVYKMVFVQVGTGSALFDGRAGSIQHDVMHWKLIRFLIACSLSLYRCGTMRCVITCECVKTLKKLKPHEVLPCMVTWFVILELSLLKFF